MWKNRNKVCFDKKIRILWRLLQKACSHLKLCAGVYKAGLMEKVVDGATILLWVTIQMTLTAPQHPQLLQTAPDEEDI